MRRMTKRMKKTMYQRLSCHHIFRLSFLAPRSKRCAWVKRAEVATVSVAGTLPCFRAGAAAREQSSGQETEKERGREKTIKRQGQRPPPKTHLVLQVLGAVHQEVEVLAALQHLFHILHHDALEVVDLAPGARERVVAAAAGRVVLGLQRRGAE